CGGEISRALRALQGDARQGLAWQGLAIDLLRKVEYPLVEPRLLEFEAIALFQCFADGGVAHAQAFTQRTGRQLRGAGLAAAMDDQVTVERQVDARGQTERLLEGRVAAGVPTGVEVGETIQRTAVVRRIVQQMGDAEIHAATAAEDLVANAAFVGI